MQSTSRSTSALLISIGLFASGSLLLLLAMIMLVSAFLPLMNGEAIHADGTIYAVAFGFEALLLFVALYFSFQKYQLQPSADRPTQFILPVWQIILVIIGTGVAIGLGFLIAENTLVNWAILPCLTVPAAALPVVLFFGLGARRLPLGPRWQAWSTLGLGMTLGPLTLLIIEIFILIVLFVLVIIYVSMQPELAETFSTLATQINLLQNNPEALFDLLTPFILRPGVIITVLAFTAVIVPLTEELLKPIGVWLFAGTLESPAQGFALGALSGAAYALVETLGSSAQTAGWAELLVTRMGTSLLHITTTALMGWAIASAWKERNYIRLFAIYLGSTALHGIWNASVILITFADLAAETDSLNPLAKIGPAMTAITLATAILLSVILLRANHGLARSVIQEPELLPPPSDVVT